MSIGWLIATTVIIVLILSFLYHKFGLKRIQYQRYFSEVAVFEGEQVEMIEVISNKKLLPLPWLRLESKFSANLQFEKQNNINIIDERFHRSVFSLRPFQKITRRHKIKCAKRGYFHIKTVGMTCGDPFGYGSNTETVHVAAEILIFPKIVPIKEMPLPSKSWQGDLIVRRWIMDDPFIIAGVRDYTFGDPMKSVNWNATARTGHLQVTKNDYTADHHLMIYLNFDLTEDIFMPIKDEILIEKGISYAASIAEHAISQGIPTGFGCNSYTKDRDGKFKIIKDSVRREPSNGNSHLHYLLETMAKLQMDRSKNFNQFLKEDIENKRTGMDILVITAILTETMERNIHLLRSLGNSVEVFMLSHHTVPETDTLNEEGEQYA
ncbi:DUF58 domain-containing protein [Evansella cellulosilytica]|uniref:DUF58 domain-containing protein n=1 Tax=Evansella cellulosilytica (strain ATCC 21833 / DSM 2522 / FERM P-1141 / JCM 9156 / N-4) TaxID=649639 RepID=E6U0E5_EVAC2|nr:DUF58 domain-containing protein [Evansella cellulosilytica]ADU30261.1 protein of unknown function DUF58 [Evansella cellulosilytica DSM 2522]